MLRDCFAKKDTRARRIRLKHGVFHATRHLACGLFLLCAGCQAPNSIRSKATPHQPTPLPIDLFTLDEPTRAGIRDMHKRDTSTYLIESRPVLFQIQGVGSAQQQHRGPVEVDRAVRVMIYALGEEKHGALCDYGWIERGNGEIVWRMQLDKSQHAGGAVTNRKVVDHIELPAGTYTLRYHSDATHAWDGWVGDPPERPDYYGITVFNLPAIERIEREIARPLSTAVSDTSSTP